MSPWWYVSACPIHLLVGNILILDLPVITLIRIQEEILIIYIVWLWFCCIISILDLAFTIGLFSERNTALSPQAHCFHVIFSQTTNYVCQEDQQFSHFTCSVSLWGILKKKLSFIPIRISCVF